MARRTKAELIVDHISMFGVIRTIVVTWPKTTAIITSGGIILAIDVSCISVPSEYLVALVISALVIGVIVGYYVTLWLHEKAADQKVAEGKIAKTTDLQYDKRYVAGSVVASIFGMLIGGFLTPIIVKNCIIGGGVYSYIAVCIVLTAIAVTACLLIIHWGLRLSLVRVKDYTYSIKEEVDKTYDQLTPEQKQLIDNQFRAWGIKKN